MGRPVFSVVFSNGESISWLRIDLSGLTDAALLSLFPGTGRALLFNFIAVAGGFGMLITSDVPPLVRFGTFVAIAVSTAFFAAMTLVPALAKLLRPAFLTRPEEKTG